MIGSSNPAAGVRLGAESVIWWADREAAALAHEDATCRECKFAGPGELHMEKHSSSIMQLTKRRAAFGLRQLMDEFRLLTASFPDLHDAFDPDDLPLAFILRRD